ncbi:MAG: hypothetical protein RBS68_13395 [Anaerolineales bacterium]|jgi:hypothetical protein|nr:hypothetical protein [Anaerolineales bacterium]
MKIDPYNFPIIIIVAFVLGVILAMILGFRPRYGSGEDSLLLLLAQFAKSGSLSL